MSYNFIYLFIYLASTLWTIAELQFYNCIKNQLFFRIVEVAG